MSGQQLSYGGAETLTQFQVLGRIQRETGLQISVSREMHLNEDLIKVSATGTLIKLVFQVSQYRMTRRGRVLTHQGLRTMALALVADRWSVLVDVSRLAEVEEVEEVHRGVVESPDAVMERVAFEEMCHRPGTARYPMDTASRERQKKRLGA